MSRRLVLFGMTVLILSGQPLLLSWAGDWSGAAFAKGGEGRGGGGEDDDGGDGDDDGGGDDGGGGDDDDGGDDDGGGGGGGGGGSGHGGGGNGDNGGSGGGNGHSGSGSGSGKGSNAGSGNNSGSGAGNGRSDNSAGTDAGNGNRKVFGDDLLRLTYANGTSERLVKGRYERLDRNGRIVERRRANATDQSRLRSLRETVAQGGAAAGLKLVIVVNSRQNAIQVTDTSGWSEVVMEGRYTLTDPNGNVVTRRSATDDDIGRLRSAVGLK